MRAWPSAATGRIAYQTMSGLEMFFRRSSRLESSLLELVKVRASTGETFYESPEDIHVVSRNVSKSQPAKFLVFFVKDKGAPPLIPVK